MVAPFISIVIPLYNKEHAIQSTLKSILDSSFTDFEVVVVDDESTDNSVSVVKSFNDTRIRIVKRGNGGPAAARNTGAKEAKGKWLLFFDADDILYSDGLEQLILPAKKYDIDIVSAKLDILEEYGRIKYRNNRACQGIVNRKTIYRNLFFLRILTHCNTLLIRKDFFLRNQFDERLRRYEDYEVILRWVDDGARVFSINKSTAALRLKWSNARYANQSLFNNDFGSVLPFKLQNFWRNCYLGTVLRATFYGYPDKQNRGQWRSPCHGTTPLPQFLLSMLLLVSTCNLTL